MTSRSILVDTSAWVDFFADRDEPWVDRLREAIQDGVVIVGDLILTEVLQGIKHDRQLRHVTETLAGWPLKTLCGSEIAFLAAANYRLLRRRGVTVRGTVDVIIATWCIEHDAALLHRDRDFVPMEHELGLILA